MTRVIFVLVFILFASVILNIFLLKNEVGVYRVNRVLDGDTFEINSDNKLESVRLIGIDSPEGNLCFGPEATLKAKNILENKNVILINDNSQGNRDIYGRLLRYAYLANLQDVGKLMIAGGFAKEYTFIDPYHKQKEYNQIQNQALIDKKGLWKECTQ